MEWGRPRPNDWGVTMRLVAVLQGLCLLLPSPLLAAPPTATPDYHIVLSRRAVGAGEHLQLRVIPQPPRGAGVQWIVSLTATEGSGLPGGIYWAPYSIPVGAPPARVHVEIRDGATVRGARAEIELQPGSVPGAENCLGPNQTFSIAAAALTPGPPFYTSGGVLVHSVDPIYPREAFARGVND